MRPPAVMSRETFPSNEHALSRVRVVRFHVRSAESAPVVVELISPAGTVYRHVEVEAPGVTDLQVAGTEVEQRQLAGTWRAALFDQGVRTEMEFELTP
ncbi:MAG: hypothetical protein JNK82_24035 [Myxococcaceae bacterium]|nr:hypothetical protein [Myxococcaceae bacterium]